MSLATLTVTPRSICGMSPQTPTNNIREALYKTYEITEANKNSTDAVKKRNTKKPAKHSCNRRKAFSFDIALHKQPSYAEALNPKPFCRGSSSPKMRKERLVPW